MHAARNSLNVNSKRSVRLRANPHVRPALRRTGRCVIAGPEFQPSIAICGAMSTNVDRSFSPAQRKHHRNDLIPLVDRQTSRASALLETSANMQKER